MTTFRNWYDALVGISFRTSLVWHWAVVANVRRAMVRQNKVKNGKARQGERMQRELTNHQHGCREWQSMLDES